MNRGPNRKILPGSKDDAADHRRLATCLEATAWTMNVDLSTGSRNVVAVWLVTAIRRPSRFAAAIGTSADVVLPRSAPRLAPAGSWPGVSVVSVVMSRRIESRFGRAPKTWLIRRRTHSTGLGWALQAGCGNVDSKAMGDISRRWRIARWRRNRWSFTCQTSWRRSCGQPKAGCLGTRGRNWGITCRIAAVRQPGTSTANVVPSQVPRRSLVLARTGHIH